MVSVSRNSLVETMKEIVKLVFYNQDENVASDLGSQLSGAVFEECVKRWPEFRRRSHSLSIELERDAPKLGEFLSFLRLHGKEMRQSRYPSNYYDSTSFQPDGSRVFERVDIDSAPLLIFVEGPMIADAAKHQDDGTLIVPRRKVKRQNIGRVLTSLTSLVCTNTIRGKLEREKFAGLTFCPVIVQGNLPPKEPLWQVWSAVTMPPVLNALTDDTGKPFDLSTSRGCVVNDLFFPWLLRFPRRDVSAMPTFDVAITKERWGWNVRQGRAPYVVVSQRFKKWCDKEELKLKWAPAVVD